MSAVVWLVRLQGAATLHYVTTTDVREAMVKVYDQMLCNPRVISRAAYLQEFTIDDERVRALTFATTSGS